MDYILVFKKEEYIINAKPKLELLKDIDNRGVIITSKVETMDFSIDFFTPKYGHWLEILVSGSGIYSIRSLWD